MERVKFYADECLELDVDGTLFEKINHVLKVSYGNFDSSNKATETLKNMYKRFRLLNELDCVIGFVTVEEDKKAYAVIFNSVAANDTIYKLQFDENESRHFIEV